MSERFENRVTIVNNSGQEIIKLDATNGLLRSGGYGETGTLVLKDEKSKNSVLLGRLGKITRIFAGGGGASALMKLDSSRGRGYFVIDTDKGNMSFVRKKFT